MLEPEDIAKWKDDKMKKEVTIILTKWAKLVNELKEDEKKLRRIKNYYDSREVEILTKTDFNRIYNANNDKIRKAHVRKKLKNTLEQKETLELKIDDSKRKISFLKAATYAEIEIMKLDG